MRYVAYRTAHEVKRKTGLLKQRFPISPPFHQCITLDEWRENTPAFLFKDKDDLDIPPVENPDVLKEKVEKIKSMYWPFFSSEWKYMDMDDWLTHPETGYQYPLKHWTEISDYDPGKGDIKYVWERARFSWALHCLRYDYHTGEDQSAFLFRAMASFIDHNPINQGPNYRCSQEISIRLINWLFVLYYYRHSAQLTSELFDKMQHAIYWQVKHVAAHINFSRIAVRNNHAISETLMLYIAGLVFPFFPESANWRQEGREWFEEEIDYQVYADGTFLQYAMNYQRVVVQLLTLALSLSQRHHDVLANEVFVKAQRSFEFLLHCQDRITGKLPNYGANDGALFFPLNDHDFRDYRPQLDALGAVLGQNAYGQPLEDRYWYGLKKEGKAVNRRTEHHYKDSGYWVINEESILTFLRAGSHKNRPSQADNFHLDLWVKGKNILRDAGTYRYNDPLFSYFTATNAHNTVTVEDADQMEKGPRFIWLHWSKLKDFNITENEEAWIFEGRLKAFQHISGDVEHHRKVIKFKGKAEWLVEDRISSAKPLRVKQYWHPHPQEIPHLLILPEVESASVELQWEQGWYSDTYGEKEKVPVAFVEAHTNEAIQTRIVYH